MPSIRTKGLSAKRAMANNLSLLMREAIFPIHQTLNKKLAEESALNKKRVLVLYFSSNWCQECQDQEKINNQVFDELIKEGVVGLKIHILDSETTTETDALAKKFDIVKENSFVILNKKGAVNFKYVGEMTSERLKDIILKAGDI